MRGIVLGNSLRTSLGTILFNGLPWSDGVVWKETMGRPRPPARGAGSGLGPSGLHGRSVWLSCSRGASRSSLVRWLSCASPRRPRAECQEGQMPNAMPNAKNAKCQECPTLLCEAATQGEARMPNAQCRMPNADCQECLMPRRPEYEEGPGVQGPHWCFPFRPGFDQSIITRCSGGRQEKTGESVMGGARRESPRASRHARAKAASRPPHPK